MDRRKAAEGIAKFRLRYGRGDGLLGFARDFVKNIVYIGGAGYFLKEWFGITLGTPEMLTIAIAYPILCYALGLLDERMGFWKFENRYASELNPLLKEMSERIESITAKPAEPQ